ncbi:hypothetical protein AX769_11320 [Frondihabitans sp. PAMC 28766]|nr:hypothetical protein AX769_11320 [Frondihabitans sp. PAMC 28766]
MATASLVAVDAASARADTDPVTISDPALAACTDQALGLAATQTFTADQLASISSLTCPDVGDISSLGSFTGLTTLNLDGGQIGEINPLSSLTSLSSVSVDNNRITDLSPLGGLTATISAVGEKVSQTGQVVGVPFALPVVTGLDGATIAPSSLTNLTPSGDGATVTATAVSGTADWGDPQTSGFTVVDAVTAALGTISPAPAATYSADRAQVGVPVSALPGAWGDGVELSYQWYSGNAAIAGATLATYTPTAHDFGSPLTVKTTGSETGYLSATVASPALVIAPGDLTSAAPTVSGTPTVFQTLRAAPGNWLPAGVTFGYQWLRNGSAISKATASSYTLTAADAGKSISVTVTGRLSAYATATRTSSAETVHLASITTAPTPKISGSAQLGGRLTATAGTWKPAGITLAYQWYRGSSAIGGASHSTYTVSASDVGKSVSVHVIGSKSGYATAAKASSSVIPRPGTLPKVGTPSIRGTAKAGATLTVNVGSWTSGTVVSVQWRRNGVAISGKTGPTYVVRTTDVGAGITVVATGRKAGYTPAGHSSAIKSVPVVVYQNCKALNAVYPHGVARDGTKYDLVSGRHETVASGTYFNTPLYNANPKRDADKDGIACEVR